MPWCLFITRGKSENKGTMLGGGGRGMYVCVYGVRGGGRGGRIWAMPCTTFHNLIANVLQSSIAWHLQARFTQVHKYFQPCWSCWDWYYAICRSKILHWTSKILSVHDIGHRVLLNFNFEMLIWSVNCLAGLPLVSFSGPKTILDLLLRLAGLGVARST